MAHNDITIPFKQECMFRNVWIKCAIYLIDTVGEEYWKTRFPPMEKNSGKRQFSGPKKDVPQIGDGKMLKVTEEVQVIPVEEYNKQVKSDLAAKTIMEKIKKGNVLLVFSDDNTNKTLIDNLTLELNKQYPKFNLSVVYLSGDEIDITMGIFIFECGNRVMIYVKNNTPELFWGTDENLTDGELKEIFNNVLAANANMDSRK
jgi:hypothetical protein